MHKCAITNIYTVVTVSRKFGIHFSIFHVSHLREMNWLGWGSQCKIFFRCCNCSWKPLIFKKVRQSLARPLPGIYQCLWWHIWALTVSFMSIKRLFSFPPYFLFFANIFHFRPHIAILKLFLMWTLPYISVAVWVKIPCILRVDIL